MPASGAANLDKEAWHACSMDSLYRKLRTSRRGLSDAEAARRLGQHGANELAEIPGEPWHVMLLRQFSSLPILLLLAAAIISLVLGFYVDAHKFIDAIAIMVAVLIAATFGFWQEYKAERALEALKKMVVPLSVAVRGGRKISIESKFLVPGDVVVLEEGSRVPADIRIVESANLASEQSALTGESAPSPKSACTLGSRTVLSERANMVFAGTAIVRGHCRGVVVRTGMGTQFGMIVGSVEAEGGKESRLQEDISSLSRTLGCAGIALAALFFGIGLLRGESAAGMFVVAVTLAVAVIPEGLPTVLAITLAIGVQKMARRNAIVRRMPSAEVLGSATVICTDKTGTITQNRMAVQEIVLAESAYAISQGPLDAHFIRRNAALRRAAEIMALCNNAVLVESGGQPALSGDPTETALLSAVSSCGGNSEKMRLEHRTVAEIPFDSGRKMMASVRLYGKKRMALVKGAPEKVLSRCTRILTPSGEEKLAHERRRKLLSESHAMGGNGMRVLALAYRPIGKMEKYTSSNTERSLVFAGLVAMEDPPRPEARQAIETCRSAGIKVVMVTGDSLATARAIAGQVGLMEEGSMAMDGADLEEMTDAELDRMLPRVALFARVTPEQKYRIVSAFMRAGHVVAVTGDGVNDAPAMKRADIGVAMGLSGTDVTREVSDIVLTDDNFASIVSAIRYGRNMFNNIKSFVRYQVSTNVAALCLMFAAPALALPLPLSPLQLLWINVMIDGPPALALGVEAPAGDEMEKPPRNPRAAFLSRNLILSIVLLGLMMAAIALAVFGFYQSYAPAKALTAVFTLFVFLQLFNALNCRFAQGSAFSRPLSNPYIFLAVAASLAVHLAIVFYAPLQEVFGTVALAANDFALIICAALLIIVFEELKKRFFAYTTVY